MGYRFRLRHFAEVGSFIQNAGRAHDSSGFLCKLFQTGDPGKAS
jgi:hypothetical protein